MMVSMTGFASAVRENELAAVSVTLRAVNHRFLDLQIRLPPTVAPLEPAIRSVLQRGLSRGRVDVVVTVQHKMVPGVEVSLNEPVVEALSRALAGARARGLVEGALTPGDLLRVPQAVVFKEGSAPAGDEVAAALEQVVVGAVEEAVRALDEMRRHEGEMLRRDLDARRDGLAALLDDIAAAADAGRASLEARLGQRIRDLSMEIGVDPALIAQEVVRFVSRSDISEEIVRFRAHLEHWARLAADDEPCGRKLDFLLQEMNREINTIGSKAEGPLVPELVVRAKAELERMREQVQNVE